MYEKVFLTELQPGSISYSYNGKLAWSFSAPNISVLINAFPYFPGISGSDPISVGLYSASTADARVQVTATTAGSWNAGNQGYVIARYVKET